VFPARYELNSYIVCRKRLVSKRLNMQLRFQLCLNHKDPYQHKACLVLKCFHGMDRSTRVNKHNVNSSSFHISKILEDRLCSLVVRVLGYRSGGPSSIPGIPYLLTI
jgi:hypothetical protein